MKTLALSLLFPVAICIAATPATPPSNPATNAPATAAAPLPPRTTAKVSLTPAAGSSVKGDLTLTNEGTAVSIRGELTGLAPGKEHGFHLHEVGECSLPDFKSAGEHFNPTKDPHGGPSATARHLGDIPNAKADENGRGTINVTLKGVTLVDKDGGPNQIVGKALVVHAMPDDYKTQPSGGSGDRISCGVIR
jgi:Cu-Zn family superoxide dismutase